MHGWLSEYLSTPRTVWKHTRDWLSFALLYVTSVFRATWALTNVSCPGDLTWYWCVGVCTGFVRFISERVSHTEAKYLFSTSKSSFCWFVCVCSVLFLCVCVSDCTYCVSVSGCWKTSVLPDKMYSILNGELKFVWLCVCVFGELLFPVSAGY